jgi:hypothetical protein
LGGTAAALMTWLADAAQEKFAPILAASSYASLVLPPLRF